jgi:hypothetical protein
LDPIFNFGGESELAAGILGPLGNQARSRILSCFDIDSQLPASAIIQPVQLQFTVVRTPFGAQLSAFALNRVLAALERGTHPVELP